MEEQKELEMGKYSYSVEEMDQGAVILVVDLAGSVWPRVVWVWTLHSASRREFLEYCEGTLSISVRCSSKDLCQIR